MINRTENGGKINCPCLQINLKGFLKAFSKDFNRSPKHLTGLSIVIICIIQFSVIQVLFYHLIALRELQLQLFAALYHFKVLLSVLRKRNEKFKEASI